MRLGIEPETANVIDSAHNARRLLDEMKSDRLKIILDAANLFTTANLANMRSVLEEAFNLLGADIVMAHAKEFSRHGSKKLLPPGAGRLDWHTYFRLLRQSGFDGPVVIHNLAERDVPSGIAFLKGALRTNRASEAAATAQPPEKRRTRQTTADK